MAVPLRLYPGGGDEFLVIAAGFDQGTPAIQRSAVTPLAAEIEGLSFNPFLGLALFSPAFLGSDTFGDSGFRIRPLGGSRLSIEPAMRTPFTPGGFSSSFFGSGSCDRLSASPVASRPPAARAPAASYRPAAVRAEGAVVKTGLGRRAE